MTDARELVDTLNSLIINLNKFNENYPRRCGNMVMVSTEMEDVAEGIIDNMQACVNILRNKDMIDQYPVTDRAEFIEWLDDVSNTINANKIEIAHAREFLQQYGY